MLPIAKDWFRENAIFCIPEIANDNFSQSSSAIQEDHASWVEDRMPGLALQDVGKADRFISALDHALGDKLLLLGQHTANVQPTDAEVRNVYMGLFTPRVEGVGGLGAAQWEIIATEYDCNILAYTALLHAVRSATWRMFNRLISLRPEEYNPERGSDTPFGRSTERVDFVVKEGTNLLYLVEGKNPGVMRALKLLLSSTAFGITPMENTRSYTALKKLIYYMILYKKNRLVVTSFEEAYILELHQTKSGKFLSYSRLIDNNEDPTLFRALFGMTLVELGDIDTNFKPFDAERAFREYEASKQTLRSSGNPGSGRGYSPGSGPGWGSGSGSGPGRKRNAIVTRSVSKAMISSDRQEVASKDGSAVLFYNFPFSGIFRPGLMEFERDPDAPFPPFPTSARIPCLTVVRKMIEGTVGVIYEAELRSPDSSNPSKFVIKVIDASLQNLERYYNCYEQLKKEYVSYYLLALGKSSCGLDRIIHKFTPTCYGLYRPKDKSKDVFALIMDFAGSVTLRPFETWSINEKRMVLQSLLSLHSIGLYHGDAEERNVARYCDYDNEISENGYKFFDFGNSHWHQCPGLLHCSELHIVLYNLFGLGPRPFNVTDFIDFQDETTRQYGLPFCNLAKRVTHVRRVQQDPVINHLDELGKVYKGIFKEK